MAIKIVLADDHPIVHDGIASARNSNIRITTQVIHVSSLLPTLKSDRADVLVTEVRLQGQDVLKELEAYKDAEPELRVVVYSGWDDPTHIARAASIGCNEFVRKSEPLEKLFRTIRWVAKGAKPPDGSLIAATQSSLRRPKLAGDQDVPLTNREIQVLRHISLGLSNREIGKSLGISVETVKDHVQNILRKLVVNDRTQAAVWAVKRNLI